MRADRLVQIVLLLQTHGRMTARDLSHRLEVSTRTIQRDLDALSGAGIPVYADRGRGGGWSLAPDYRTRLDGLHPAEAMSLFIGSTEHVLTDLGLDSAAASATTKLLSTVPSRARRDAEIARERVLVDHSDWWDVREPSPWLPIVRQAVWEERKVRIRYGSAEREFTVAPLGLVAKKRSWYVVALRHDGEIRTYRVPRLRRAVQTGEQFDRPVDFNLAEHWKRAGEEYFASLRDFPVRLCVSDAVGYRLRWAPNAVIDDATQRPDGWWDVAMTFENADEARIYLLGLAGHIVIVDPPEFRDDVLRAARDLLAAHGDGSTVHVDEEPR